jgi:hypothetical protein
MIDGFRNRGLSTPFSSDVYARAGISESLIPRVKNSMEGLDLVDGEGNPTPQLIALRQAKTDEFRAALADVVKAAYAEVFQFVDPMNDDLTRITDAFRVYQPHGQRARMVTLFMGLCEAAGLAPSESAKASRSGSRPSAPAAKKRPNGAGTPRRGQSPAMAARGLAKAMVEADDSEVPAIVTTAIAGIPWGGWTEAQRTKFLAFFESVLDFTVPIRTVTPAETDLESGVERPA